jgi:RimJ/RimL family protein N-acetyltransferase
VSLLSPFGPEHVEATYRWLSDPELRRQIDSLGRPSESGNRQYWQERAGDTTRPTFAVTVDGSHVGNCGLVMDQARRKAELWIYLGESRGSGVGTRAVHELLARVFGDLGLYRAQVRVLVSNDTAVRFWRGLGFIEEGRLRSDTWHDDEPVDALLFSLLAPEYAASHP